MSSIAVGNIFDVVTDNKMEASELKTCSDLMIVLRDIIDGRGWTRKEASKYLGLTQSHVSDLKNGKIEKFSVDILMNCLYQVDPDFKLA